jgi:RHS repeat-associated protein
MSTVTMMNTIRKCMKSAAALLVAVIATMASPGDALATASCADKGGNVLCTTPVHKGDPTYSICDDAGPYLYRIKAWCLVRGGTWNDGTGQCEGTPTPDTAANASTRGQAFVDQIHGQSCGAGLNPSPCSDYNCTCHQITSMGLITTDWASLGPYSGREINQDQTCGTAWAETIILNTYQDVGCPAGYLYGSDDPGRPCFKVVPCRDCVGNPIDVGDGSKLQREVDYASPAPGGLRFERLYNSAGYFTLTQREPVVTDYWRHTYSSRVVAYQTNAYVMAAAQRADGTLILFNNSGVEFHNINGAAHRLVKQTDGGGNVTGWQLTTPQNDVEQYNAQGQLTSITTRSGFVTTLTYTSGRLTSITDAFGRSLTLTYDTNGNLYTMTDPSSRVYTYGYDTHRRLATVTYPDTKTRQYLYENTAYLHALTGIIDERNVRISTYGYDSLGRGNYTEKTGPDNHYSVSISDGTSTVTVNATDGYGTALTYNFNKVNGALKKTLENNYYLGDNTWTYDANGDPLTFTNRRGYQTTYVYDSTRHLETSRTEAYGTAQARTIATTWNSTYRLPATITEPSGVSGVNLVTTFTYDTAGNLTRKNMTAGTKVREWNYTVNSRGQVLTIDGPRTDVTDVTTIAYYADNDSCVGCRGQVYTVTNAASQVTTFNSYDLDGRPTQITDANGVATTLTYKTRGWLASRTTGGETTSYDYDAAGNLTLVTMPDGSWISYEYDVAGGLVGVGDSLGNSIDYELDVMGNRVEERSYDLSNTLAKMSQKVYDGAQRLARDVGAASQTTVYGYDGQKNLTSVTDPLGRVTTNTYDALDRLTSILDAASGTTTFTYDAKDRLATVRDPQISATTQYTYDGLGNLTQQVSPDTGTTAFTYDNAGNVATQTDARSVTTTYSYDVLNRVTAATVTDGAVSYEYDNTTTGGAYARGKLTKITDPSGNTTYVYDSLGRVTSKVQTVTASPANKTFTVGYSYSNGRQTGITYPSGRAIAYSFDTKGQVASITVDGSTTVLSGAAYFPFGAAKSWTWGNGQSFVRGFDQDGRIASVTIGPSVGTYADLSQVFGYDSLNRMISANLAAGQTQGFTYDANSNRTSSNINGASTTYSYPSNSHKLSSLSGATTRSFTYDSAGNVTASQSITYVYDGRGRMKSAGSTNYLVNGLGQRVKKSTASVDTFFVYDEAGHLIGEYDTTGAPIEETLWIGDTPVAIVKPKTGGFDVFYIWSDNLGTPRQVTDTSNVSRWEWANNDPFGNNAPNENPASAGVFSYNLRFPGQYYDVETGKHYNYFRDYDPAIGRYIQSDPIGLDGGLNTYGYDGGNPLVNIDPEGLAYFCMYSQGKGQLSCFDNNGAGKQVIDDPNCYAGKGKHKNVPSDDCLKDRGPLPKGWYDISSGFSSSKGNPTFKLTPHGSTFMCVPLRNNMLIHADSSAHPGAASDGCIVCKKSTRDQLNSGGGGTLLVTQ